MIWEPKYGCSYCDDCAVCGSNHQILIDDLKLEIEKLKNALKEIYKNEFNEQRPNNAYSKSAQISFEALNGNIK